MNNLQNVLNGYHHETSTELITCIKIKICFLYYKFSEMFQYANDVLSSTQTFGE